VGLTSVKHDEMWHKGYSGNYINLHFHFFVWPKVRLRSLPRCRWAVSAQCCFMTLPQDITFSQTLLNSETTCTIQLCLLDNGSVTRFPVSLFGWQTCSHDNAYIGRPFPRQRIKPNCSTRCSLSSRQRIILRGWLIELTDSEGSDNEMRGSEV
jgi:hypothetical protein